MRWFIISVLCCIAQADQEQVIMRNPDSADISRIVGGSAATIESYPFAVQVQQNGKTFCTGSLLTMRHVLSVAHCFVNNNGVTGNPNLYTVLAGATLINKDKSGTSRKVSTIIVHGRFNVPARDNDIAVIVLASRLRKSKKIDTVSIPQQGYDIPINMPVINVGWGVTNAIQQTPATSLNHVTVYSVNRTICAERYQVQQQATGVQYPITSNMICSGILNVGGPAACQGDSGGPVLSGRVLVGLTSWRVGCGDPFYPGVNTNVGSYTKWVNDTVNMYSNGSIKNISILLITLSLISSMINKY